MEVDVAAMPATTVPTTPAAANHDVGAAIVVIVAARIAVIAAVIICGRADSDAKRPRVESHLRHCRRRCGRRQQGRSTKSKRKLSHFSPPVSVASERETRSGVATFPGTRFARGN